MNAWNGRRGQASNLLWSQNTPAKGISMATTETSLDSPRLDEQWKLEVKEAPFSPAWLHFLLNFYIIAGDRLIITHCYASGNSIQPVEGQPFLPCWSKVNSEWKKQTPIIILVQSLLYLLCFEQVLKTMYMLSGNMLTVPKPGGSKFKCLFLACGMLNVYQSLCNGYWAKAVPDSYNLKLKEANIGDCTSHNSVHFDYQSSPLQWQ